MCTTSTNNEIVGSGILDSSELPIAKYSSLTSSFVTVLIAVLILVFCFLIIASVTWTGEKNRCPSIWKQTMFSISKHTILFSSYLVFYPHFFDFFFYFLAIPIQLQRQLCNNNSCANYFSRHFAVYESTSISLVRYIAHNEIVKRQRLARKVARFHSHQQIERPVTSSHCTQWN